MPPNNQNPPNPPAAPKADDKAPAPHPLSTGAPATASVSTPASGFGAGIDAKGTGAKAGGPDVRPAGTRYRILHSGVGRHGKGEVVSAGDLGGDPERLLRLGAIAEEG